MYAFTCCNLRVGKFDVPESNMIIFWHQYFIKRRLMDSGNETHKAFATCASQYSWNTAIENQSNATVIWSGHGIQAWDSPSCFDHSCTKLLGNLGSPLTLKRTWIYALLISNRRTAGTCRLLKPWQFSPPSVMFYFILPYLTMYIKCRTFSPH